MDWLETHARRLTGNRSPLWAPLLLRALCILPERSAALQCPRIRHSVSSSQMDTCLKADSYQSLCIPFLNRPPRYIKPPH